jgi:hypothetical protein
LSRASQAAPVRHSRRLASADAGSSGYFEHHELATWTAEIEDISLTLPAGTADVLVAIRPESRVWLDSMRTE